MPLIIQPLDDSAPAMAAALSRLVAAMLNMERGAREYSAVEGAVERVALPHPPWPLQEVPALTTRGATCHVHYRPACGMIYYSGGAGPLALAEQLAARLDEWPADHLTGARATALSPTAILRSSGECTTKTVVTGPRAPFRKPLPPGAARANRPARLLLVAMPDDRSTPPLYSTRAVFTWVFLPMSAVFAIGKRPTLDAASMNALVAGIVIDGSRMLTCLDGFESVTISPDAIRTPPNIADWSSAEGRPPAFAGFSKNYALLLNKSSGSETYRITYIGDYRAVVSSRHVVSSRRAARRMYTAMETAPWPNCVVGCVDGARRSACVCCAAPLGGDAILITDPRNPYNQFPLRTQLEALRSLAAGAPLAHPSLGAPTSVLICEHCWSMIDQPMEAFSRMLVEPRRVTIPWTQADAASALGLAGLANLLGSPAVRNAAGAYTVSICAGGDAVNIVLAGATLGPWPMVDYPGKIIDHVVTGVNIIDF